MSRIACVFTFLMLMGAGMCFALYPNVGSMIFCGAIILGIAILTCAFYYSFKQAEFEISNVEYENIP
jgi:hypothetical protein